MRKNGKKKNGNGLCVLAIDPGCRHTGWSVNEITPSGKIRVVSHGVFDHNYSVSESAKFIKNILTSNMVVLIEDPPIIRVNASTSHVLAKIFGAIYGAVVTSKVASCERIPPKSWQYGILKEHYKKAKEDGRKITAKEKDILLKALINKNITRKEIITSPHVIDTIGMVIYYCEKNGSTFDAVVLKEVLAANSKKKKKVIKKRRRNAK